MRITRFSVVLLLTISLLLLSHAAEAGGGGGGGGGEASSSRSSGSKFNLFSRFKKTSQPSPLHDDNVLNSLKAHIPNEKFAKLQEHYQEGFQKGYLDEFGRPANADGIRGVKESEHVEKWHNELEGYIQLAAEKFPK